MTKRLIALGLLLSLVFALNGCGNGTQSLDEKTEEVPASSFSESNEETSEPTEEAVSDEPTPTDVPDIPAQKESESIRAPVIPKTDSSKKNEAETTRQPEKSQIKEEYTPPKEIKPTEIQQPEPEKPKPTQEPKQDFDVTEWVDFTKSYAQSIGFTLDSTSIECWDNPITANPNRSNLKDDIMSRLNRYKQTEGFTAVWVWVEKVSDTEYELYIGYA